MSSDSCSSDTSNKINSSSRTRATSGEDSGDTREMATIKERVAGNVEDTTGTLFAGLTFKVALEDREEQNYVEKLIYENGGKFASHNARVAILPSVCNPDAKSGVNLSFTKFWLFDCLEGNSLEVGNSFCHVPLASFENMSEVMRGVVVAVSQYQSLEKIYMMEVMTAMGGRCQGDFNFTDSVDETISSLTHIVCRYFGTDKAWLEKIWNVPVVVVDWIIDSFNNQRRLDEDYYSTRTNTTSNQAAIPTTNQSSITDGKTSNDWAKRGTHKAGSQFHALLTTRMPERKSSKFDLVRSKESSSNIYFQNEDTSSISNDGRLLKKLSQGGRFVEQGGASSCSPLDEINKIFSVAETSHVLCSFETRSQNLTLVPIGNNRFTKSQRKCNSPMGVVADLNKLKKRRLSLDTRTDDNLNMRACRSSGGEDRLLDCISIVPKLRAQDSSCLLLPCYGAHDQQLLWVDDNEERSQSVVENVTGNPKVCKPDPTSMSLDAVVHTKLLSKDNESLKDANGKNIQVARCTPGPMHKQCLCQDQQDEGCQQTTHLEDNHMDENCMEVCVDEPQYSSTDVVIFPLFLPQHPIFAISLREDKKLEVMSGITLLGGSVSNLSHFDDDCNALITTKLVRSERIMCCIASGKLVMKLNYLKKSLDAGRFLPVEKEFLWHEENIHASKEREIARASIVWLNRIMKDENMRPMTGKKFCILKQSRSNTLAFKRLIRAAGGQVVDDIQLANCIIKEDSVKASIPDGVQVENPSYFNKLILAVEG